MKLRVKETGKVINAFCIGLVKVQEGVYDGAKDVVCFSSFDEGEEGNIYKKSELEPIDGGEMEIAKKDRIYEFVKDGFAKLVPDILKSRPGVDEITDAFGAIANAAIVFVEGVENLKV